MSTPILNTVAGNSAQQPAGTGNETLPLWPISYAYDVSKYADFAIRAATVEEAREIAESLLRRGILPDVLDWTAQEFDNGTDNLRVFSDDGDEPLDEEMCEAREFEAMAKDACVKLPEDWRVIVPAKQEAVAPVAIAGRTVYWLTSDISNAGIDTDLFGSEKAFLARLRSLMEETLAEAHADGLYDDDENERADKVRAFLAAGEVMEAWGEFRGDSCLGDSLHDRDDSYLWGEQFIPDEEQDEATSR